MGCTTDGGDYARPIYQPPVKKAGSSTPTETIRVDTTATVSFWSSGDSTTVKSTAQTDSSATDRTSESSPKKGRKTGGTTIGTSSEKKGKKTESGSRTTNQNEQKTKSPAPDNTNKSRFQTTIPVFNGLNTHGFKTPDLRTKTNVDIHIKGNNTQAVNIEERPDGSSVVYFEGSEVYAVIPPDHPKEPKPIIVFDPETNTMAFSNIEGDGFEVKLLAPTDSRYPKDAERGTNILFNKCHATHVDIAELNKGQNGLTQTVVFQNTHVDEFDSLGDNYITIGNTVINNADNHSEKANGKNYTYWATDGQGTVNRDERSKTSNGNGQSGYTLNEGYRWISGSENEINLSNTDGVTNKKVQISVGDQKIIDADYSGAYLCRQFNGVDIYFKGTGTKSDYTRKIINSHNGDTWFFDFNGTKITFPPQDPSNKAKIYYDADTGTLTLEGIKDLEVNYSEAEEEQDKVALFQDKTDREKVMTSSGTKKTVRMYIKDCHCKTVNCMETNATEDDAKFKLSHTQYRDVLAFENSTVDNLYTNNDLVVKDEYSEIGYYAGDRTLIVGSGSEDLINNNHIEDVKNKFRSRGSLDISNKEGFPDVNIDNVLLKGTQNGTNIFIQGDDSGVSIKEDIIQIKGTKIRMPAQTGERGTPNIYYDAGTDAIILENIKGARVESIKGTETKIYLKNSTCSTIDTQEHSFDNKRDKNGEIIESTFVLSDFETSDKERDLIYIDETSSVEELFTNADYVHLENGASVRSYAGYNTAVSGFNTTVTGPEDIEEINSFGQKFINKKRGYETITRKNNDLIQKRYRNYNIRSN